jgi:hypothetical protein
VTSAADLINGSLRLIGVLAEGEVPSADASQDTLDAFNAMLDSWNTERLSVYATSEDVYTWPAGQKSRTIGPTGDFVKAVRPIQIDPSTYFIGPSNLSFPVTMVNQDQYNAIALKNVTSTYPYILWVNNSFPDITLTTYPVPTSATEWHIVSVTQLSQISSLGDDISLPPGYIRTLRYNLACELAPEWGVEPSTQVQRIARISKRNIKRINNPDDLMAMPYALVSNQTRYNIFTGNYG